MKKKTKEEKKKKRVMKKKTEDEKKKKRVMKKETEKEKEKKTEEKDKEGERAEAICRPTDGKIKAACQACQARHLTREREIKTGEARELHTYVYMYCISMHYIYLFEYFCHKSGLVKWSGSAVKDWEVELEIGGPNPRINTFMFVFHYFCVFCVR